MGRRLTSDGYGRASIKLLIEALIQERREHFLKEYGVVPEFKAVTRRPQTGDPLARR